MSAHGEEDEDEYDEDATTSLIEEKVNNSKLNTMEDREKLHELMVKYQNIFKTPKKPIPDYFFRITLMDDTPFKGRTYPIPECHKAEVALLINSMIRDGIIMCAQTAYTSPVLFVKKKDGSLRMCLDARKLNSVTKPMYDKPPRIDEVLTQLHGACLLYTSDAADE